MKCKFKLLALILALLILLCGCSITFTNKIGEQYYIFKGTDSFASLDEIPEFDGKTPYVIINDNQPAFSDSDLVGESYEYYSPLDNLGRCGTVIACVGIDIMPTEERGAIGMVKPTGWHTVKYDNVDGKYLYNRCHLIGYQLTGENANEQNLITGTRYLNIEGMLPFEDLIADYVKETKNHVLYRVTPIFKDNNLLASGVQIEAMSIEDGGEEICFNVYAYNSQPDIVIDYATGDSYIKGEDVSVSENDNIVTTYIINKNSKKFHLPDCASVKDMKPQNKKGTDKSKAELEQEGYEPCKSCIG